MASVPRPIIRRGISIPVFTIGFLLAGVASIVVVPILALVDLLQGNRRLRLARVWLLGVGAAAAEVGGWMWSALLWIRYAPLGQLLDEPSMAAHTRVQDWWVRAHLRNLRRFAGLRLVIDDPELTHEGHAIVIARHASHADAVLPAFLFHGIGGHRLRYTLKDTLQWSPGLDLAGNRLPDVFVDRAPGPDSPVLTRLEDLAHGCDHRSVCVIFPEGTFFTPDRLDRAAARLGTSRPDLEATARRLQYMLPPRPAGTLAMLRGAPDADVVFVGHVGVEGFGSLKEIVQSIPLAAPMRIRLWRYERAAVPHDDHDRTTWLLERWLVVDEWIADEVARREAGDAVAPDANGVVPEEVLA